METGTAIFLASLMSPLTGAVVFLWGRYEIRVAAKKAADQLVLDNGRIAFQLAQHNTEVAAQLAENTALTQETKDKTERTYQEMNGMKDALIKAEKASSEAKGLALGIERGRIEEKERAVQVKKR